jgi:hypothetical protein
MNAVQSGKSNRQAVPRWMLFLMGILVPVVREIMEMLYQFEYDDYRFDSSKVERALGREATAGTRLGRATASSRGR